MSNNNNNNNCDLNGNCNGSTWGNWARWLVLGLIILAAIFIFFLCSCISARRRRRLGYQPYRGTQWTLGRTPPGHAPAQYNQNVPPQQQQQQPYYGGAPPQQPDYNYGYNNNNNNANPPPYGAGGDYYGGGRNDVELQSPPNAYKPPAGPPPGRY